MFGDAMRKKMGGVVGGGGSGGKMSLSDFVLAKRVGLAFQRKTARKSNVTHICKKSTFKGAFTLGMC